MEKDKYLEIAFHHSHTVLSGEILGFADFLIELTKRPHLLLRNIFPVFRDMVVSYMGPGVNEYPDDPETIHYLDYPQAKRLFIDGADHPFFSDRLFNNKFRELVEEWKIGAQQNKLYAFVGPPGCGKSTFLNVVLSKLEAFANSYAGMRYEILWRLDRTLLGGLAEMQDPALKVLNKILLKLGNDGGQECSEKNFCPEDPFLNGDLIDVPCPNHDNPILIFPQEVRKSFLEKIIPANDKKIVFAGGEKISLKEFRQRLFSEKEYAWIFKDRLCTSCAQLYEALFSRVEKKPEDIFKMIFARPYVFNRRISQGITVFNPDDKSGEPVLQDKTIQARLNRLLKSEGVQRKYTPYARTNQGVYALMDVKGGNVDRARQLHNLLSESVHKVGDDLEEEIHSFFVTVMNLEDEQHFEDLASFLDRLEIVHIPYVREYQSEVRIYFEIFGKQKILNAFLPGVIHNFAKIVVSTRLSTSSTAMDEWIKDSSKYKSYCDEKLLLLKMEVYAGVIPEYLTDDDVKKLTAERRLKIIKEGDNEGRTGISGRDAIGLFGDFFLAYVRPGKLITMKDVMEFFEKKVPEPTKKLLPHNFLISLLRTYDFSVLQQLKSALYFYNDEQIAADVLNYMFAATFDPPRRERCVFTGETLEITSEYLLRFEKAVLGSKAKDAECHKLRKETVETFTSQTLQEINIDGLPVRQTTLFQELFAKYVKQLKGNVLTPFKSSDGFRNAVKSFGNKEFETNDKRTKDSVVFMIKNLTTKSEIIPHPYTVEGAKEIVLYVLDNKLDEKF